MIRSLPGIFTESRSELEFPHTKEREEVIFRCLFVGRKKKRAGFSFVSLLSSHFFPFPFCRFPGGT